MKLILQKSTPIFSTFSTIGRIVAATFIDYADINYFTSGSTPRLNPWYDENSSVLYVLSCLDGWCIYYPGPNQIEGEK